ncbi:MAG: hypothetical protein QOH93_3336 [Chloroflexia bacterium]|jgi:hypothetical protein|nr:hypothetical protein [Chloroflexia bacterium]
MCMLQLIAYNVLSERRNIPVEDEISHCVRNDMGRVWVLLEGQPRTGY